MAISVENFVAKQLKSSHLITRASDPSKPTEQNQAGVYRHLAVKLPEQADLVQKRVSQASQPTNQPSNKPTNQPTNKPTGQLTTEQLANQPTNRGADLPNYLQYR